MTYRAEPGMQNRHGRRRSTVSQKSERQKAGCRYVLDEPYAVQTYLDYQGEKLEQRFDARAYIAQLDAMDHHDISRRPPWAPPPENEREDTEDAAEYYPHDASRSWGLMRIESPILSVGIDTDALYHAHHMKRLAHRAESLGKYAEYKEIESPHGHDAFLLEADQVNEILKDGLALPLNDE
jgi:homoserine O-acetyltransferase